MAKPKTSNAAPNPPMGAAPNPPSRAAQGLPATGNGDTVAGYSLPPILRGIQPGVSLSNEPQDYAVSVIWASRRQIDAMARAMARQHPELAQGLEIMRAFMCDMDTMRDAVLHEMLDARAAVERGDAARASEALSMARQMLGRWNDERRLGLS